MKRRLAIVAVGVAVGMTVVDTAQGMTTLNSKVSRVVVFKDGYCMIVKEVRGRIDSDRRAVVNEVLGGRCSGHSGCSQKEQNRQA